MNRKIERRVTQTILEAGDGDGMSFTGYAALFNVRTHIGPLRGGWFEEIAPGAFSRVLAEKQDVRMVFNHDANQLLARTSSGPLRLTAAPTRLRADVDLPDTSLGR